ncbi:MAG TPA: phosphoribosylanthranilate isomerase [Candidatus Desulfofervidus auxilii]|uniref:N-(5'-phosphoribosyl)anthranilate isomerase n=1 Tax=Desulfofervidus auxilii TaxID=1621989 RepID=A0A7V0IAU1_DESA2|nr:phosphoribosylanthranilate isomerase [Candidatus Desulfofervidus auxilii]
MRIKVKICGITRIEDALFAADLGVHALGFIFYSKSPRYVTPQKVREIIESLPPFLQTVGVFVDEKKENIINTAQFCGLNLIQLHGHETPMFCEMLGFPCIKALSVKNERSLNSILSYKGKVKAILLDTYKKGKFGGSGETFNWSLAVKAKAFEIPLILAGGLKPENIKEAIKIVKPFAIDVNSGIEKAPGIKDRHLMERLFEILRKIEDEIA